jgi:hypothetical protein
MSDSPSLSEKRIRDVTAARTLFTKLRKNSETRRSNWAKVQGQLDGAAPFINSELVSSGQGWRCNINFRDASSTLEQVLVSYWRLVHDTKTLAAVTIHEENPNIEVWQSIFEDAFNRFFDDWGADYVRNYLLFSQNHVAYGVGLTAWSDAESPRWEVVKLGDIEVPEKTKASVDAMNVVLLRQEWSIEELWKKIRTPELAKSAELAGWNVEVVKQFVTKYIKGYEHNIDAKDVLEVQEQIRNNALGISCEHAPAKLVQLLIKEYDGKISRYIFAEDCETEKFLFDDSSVAARPESMRHCLAAVFFEAGNGLFWGTKGFGVKNAPIAATLNRLKSRAVDRTLLDGLNFRDMEEGSRQTVPITNIGPFNILPKGLEQIPQYPTGRTALETIELLERQSGFNNARYRDQSRQVADTQTATQATILAHLQSQVDVANATLYLSQFAKNVFAEQFRRLRKKSDDPDAKKFFERCVKIGGMPEKVFRDAEITIRTGADPGAASLALQAAAAKELLSMSADPNVNSRWAWERYITGTFGAQAVTKALNPVNALGDISAQRFALMENSDMGEGNALPVDPKDNHAAHIPVHLQPLSVIASQFAQSGRINPDSVVAIQNAVPHVEAHFEYLKADKLQANIFQQLWPQWTDVKNTLTGIMRQVERMDAEAQRVAGNAPRGVDPAAAVGALSQQ